VRDVRGLLRLLSHLLVTMTNQQSESATESDWCWNGCDILAESQLCDSAKMSQPFQH
jgi:hypothetical protein